MRATILAKAIILTKARRAVVSMMAKESIVDYCVFYFYYPTIFMFIL